MPSIIPQTYKFSNPLSHRVGPPPGIVWHHAAGGPFSAQDIHRMHIGAGYSGIGYHYYVRKDGRIYRGRPEWAMGAHCLNHNDWLGVCAEGNYQTTKVMPAPQLSALQWLHDDIKRRRGALPDKRHKDMSGNSTACPGIFYPFARVTSGVDNNIKVTIKESWLDRFKIWKAKQK